MSWPSAACSTATSSVPARERIRYRLLWATCLALLVLGAAWRWPTLHHLADYDRYAMSRLAYSDIIKLYFTRNLGSHTFPYLQQPVEYPVLTGLTIWITSFVPGLGGYFLANALLLVAAGLSTFFVLSLRVNPGALARYALAPGLALYVALNWDMLSVLALSAALLLASRGRFGWTGVALGVGTSTKLYPAFVLPAVLALALVRGKQAGRPFQSAIALLEGFVAVTVVVNEPIARLNFSGWTFFLRFQSGRPLNPDAIWSHLPALPDAAITRCFVAVFILITLWTALRVYLNGGMNWEAGALAGILAFLLLTRDYSPQYDLWVLPFLAVLRCPWRLWVLFVSADVAYYAAIFLFLFLAVGGRLPVTIGQPEIMLGIGVWLRELALVALLAWAAVTLIRPPVAARCPLALTAATFATLAAIAGGAVGVVAAPFEVNSLMLAGEAVGLSAAAALGLYAARERGWTEGHLAPLVCLAPLAAIVVMNFPAIGSYLVSAVILLAIAAIETWLPRRREASVEPAIRPA